MGNSSLIINDIWLMLSDFMVMIACLYCTFNIKNKAKSVYETKLNIYWNMFFLFETISFFFGGISHGFIYKHFQIIAFLSWHFSVFGVVSFAVGICFASKNIGKKNIIGLYILASICIILTTVFNLFIIVVLYCFLIMFIIIYINEKYKIISFKYDFSKGIIVGTLLFLLSALFFICDIQAAGMNAGTISHILIAVGIIFFGDGCLKTIMKGDELYEFMQKERVINENQTI